MTCSKTILIFQCKTFYLKHKKMSLAPRYYGAHSEMLHIRRSIHHVASFTVVTSAVATTGSVLGL